LDLAGLPGGQYRVEAGADGDQEAVELAQERSTVSSGRVTERPVPTISVADLGVP
jgi:hypothetical protein